MMEEEHEEELKEMHKRHLADRVQSSENEAKIRELEETVADSRLEKELYLSQYERPGDSVEDRIMKAVKSEEEKSFLFLDTIIEVPRQPVALHFITATS